MGVSGAQAVARTLINNKSVKFLNVFNNKIGFDGAKAFADTLAKNQTLEFLELGHNRIRNKGLHQIAQGMTSNPNSAIHTLGLRFNFLTDEGL